MLYAHIAKPDNVHPHWRCQSTEAHNTGVARLASDFAHLFGLDEVAYVMGLLHDKGKEQTAWQHYIQCVTGYKEEYAHEHGHIPHAIVGASVARRLYPHIAPLIGQPIAGHHRGLYDYCEYEGKIMKEIPSDVTLGEALPYTIPRLALRPFDLHHLVRMLFSCLVDADSLDTERFMSPEQTALRGSSASIQELLDTLEHHLAQFGSPQTDVNRLRCYVQEQCRCASHEAVGFHSLTVPTGGGKTLASVLWALHHAVHHHLRRVIIAIPYTSIIVQTASTLKTIFGEDNVLEHHSGVNPDDVADRQLRQRFQLATENWDCPIVVTTNVQLFESLFSNRRSDCRKLHNIAQSVIILDEVQTLPLGFYKPIVNTLDTLQRIFGCSVLFTTASQPVLTGRIEATTPTAGFEALTSVREIIPAEARLHERLRRTELRFIPRAMSYDELAAELARHDRVLCIVNTRRDARELYERLPQEGLRLHLSRMMCPAHIQQTITQLKAALSSSTTTTPIRVVATQLIEAGVDIDFPVVFRQEAGLDSILQAAGRCNREGLLPRATTHVFSLAREHNLPPGHISQCNNARLAIGDAHDWFAPEVMRGYFLQLHARTDDFDMVQTAELLYKRDCEFETTAQCFRLIDETTVPVIVNWGHSMTAYQRLLSQQPTHALMRELAQYSVSLRLSDFQQLRRIGAIEEPREHLFAITHPGFYGDSTGLTTNNQWLEETYII